MGLGDCTRKNPPFESPLIYIRGSIPVVTLKKVIHRVIHRYMESRTCVDYHVRDNSPTPTNKNTMNLYGEVTIKIVEKCSFETELGEKIEYFNNFLKDESGAVLELTSGKKDFTRCEGKTGVATFSARESNGKLKLSLINFIEGEKIVPPEEETMVD